MIYFLLFKEFLKTTDIKINAKETHKTMLKPGHRIVFGELAKRGSKGVQKKLRTAMLLPFWQQTGEKNLQYVILIPDLHALRHTGGNQVILLLNIGGGVNQMPQPASNTLRPQSRVGGQDFIIFWVALDVRCVHSIQRTV